VRFYWTHIWKSHAYRSGTVAERRFIEIRFSLGRTIRAKRRQLRLTQAELAERIGAAQSTISSLERGVGHAALDIAVRALIGLDANDDEVAAAFNAGAREDIQRLRKRASERYYPRVVPGISSTKSAPYAREGV
jgi:transcriptional regulator with XRE-family HTH domain